MFDGDPASPEAIESILAAMQIGMGDGQKEEQGKIYAQKIPEKEGLTPMNVRARVKALIKKYRTSDPFEMMQGMNAILVYYPLDDGVRGFYQYYKRNNIIYIDERLSQHDRAFVLSHEMGHMFFA